MNRLAFVLSVVFIAGHLFACKTSAPIAQQERKAEKVKFKDLNDAPVTDMAELIRRQPNVTVRGSGNNIDVEIRGQKSFTATTQPLYVLDGRRLGHDFQLISALNPADVARIDIVRDPASLASYGVGASNGVIEIITKKK